jgi:predicted porin
MIGGLVAVVPARAVYAPIPEQDQGKELVVTLQAQIYHDSNIFGSETGAIASTVYEIAPKLAFNAALSDQTFATASYLLTYDYYENRPGDRSLFSHDLAASIDHTFSKVTSLHFSDDYSIVRNPASLLSGVTLNTDQSYKRNEFDGRFETNVAPQLGLAAKAQSIYYSYDDDALASELNHLENLYGLSLGYDVVPELRAVGEVRHSDILYDTGGDTKNKHTDFLIGGADYAVAKQVTATARLGYQWRQRDGDSNTSAPYIELSGKYDYAPQSFVSAGYVYTFEENSDTIDYNDTKVNRFFFNLQHALSAIVVASGSIDYEPSQLQGRHGVANADETTTRFGAALSYLPTKNWRITASYDYDNIDSDVAGRSQNRNRTGLSAAYTF